MGRKYNPLYKDPQSGIYYARRYEGKKRAMLTLATNDPFEAMQRLPIVQSIKMSWLDYQKIFSSYEERPLTSIDNIAHMEYKPPIQFHGRKETLINIIEEAIRKGKATYDPETGEWLVRTGLRKTKDPADAVNAIREKLTETDNLKEIEGFYRQHVMQLFVDKTAAKRNSEFWLTFLRERGVRSWKQINETLLADFKEWRKNTVFSRSSGNKGIRPSALVVNWHLRYLSKSFDEARDRGYIRYNPIKNWKPEKHTAPLQNSLSRIELKKLLADPRWQQDYLMNGLEKLPLGYKLLDIVLLLFASCKRRKEILKLRIEEINFKSHYAHYIETKNSSKGTPYVIHKAFWLTPNMERFLKRIIGDRIEGLVFPSPIWLKKGASSSELFNADYLSEVFKEVAERVAPQKRVTLNNLRHSATDIMEKAGLTDEEIDAALGHYNVKTALPNYQDRSADAIARHLSKRTKKGIEVLCKAVKEFLA